MKIQVKTEKILDLISKLKTSLREKENINIYSREKTIVISYMFCERRTSKYDLAKAVYKDVNKFIEIMNNSKLTIQKIKLIELKDYEDDTEYDEYEVEFGRTFYIEKVGQASYIENICKGKK